jgi:endonuclease/exonuclease/phosphatase family metal-dependent hydrolase
VVQLLAAPADGECIGNCREEPRPRWSAHVPRRRTARPLTAAAAALGLLAALLMPARAQASGWPAHPTGIHVVAATGSSFTVAMDRAANTRYYRVYASTVHSDVFYANLKAGRHPSTLHWGTSTVPRVTVSGLPYTTTPYYWRVETFTGSAQSYDGVIRQQGLRPATPTNLAVRTSPAGGTYLTWSSGRVTGFTVQRALDPAFTAGLGTFTIRGNNHQFTPYNLTMGTHYYFRIRGFNLNSHSGFGPSADGVKAKREQPVKAMAYNILQAISDGSREPGGTVAPWSQRRVAAAALVQSVDPDVFSVEEGWPYIGDPANHVRQVDSLASALGAIGSHYAVARTEITWPNPGWHRYGNYIMYNTDRYEALGTAGLFDTDSGANYAPYVELQNRTTGARLLYVGAHLTASVGRTYDSVRASQTASLVAQGTALADQLGVPVIFAGDFNSDPEQNAPDGPNSVMHSDANRIADARLVAQTRYNERYDSMNELMVTPNPYSLFIDYLYLTPGVSASTWGMAMRFSSGKMVGTIPSDHNPIWAWVQVPY